MRLGHGLVFPDNTTQNSASNALITQIGDGSDGDLIVAAGQTFVLDRERNFRNVTIQNGGVFNPASYRILCTGALTIDVGGIIDLSGFDAAGSSPPAKVPVGSISTGGTNGGTGTATVGGVGATQADNLGGAGGAGGAGAGGAGGTGGNSFPPSPSRGSYRTLFTLSTGILLSTAIYLIKHGSTGGAGGGDGSTGKGGAGATSGGFIIINAKSIVHNGLIRSRGGIGYRAFSNVGGGGSGGGGVIFCNSIDYTGNGSFDVAGGVSGGLTPAQPGTGVAGVAGGAGTFIQTVWS